MKVGDVMTTVITATKPEASLKEAANLMLTEGVSGLPVIAEDGRLLGIVTEGDFVFEEASHSKAREPRLLDVLFGRVAIQPADAPTVADVMTTKVLTINRNKSLADAARVMVERGVKRLPVVDDGDMLVGIVSRADVLKAFARPDSEIRDDIERLLSHRIVQVDPDAVTVDVADGVVRMQGLVETWSDGDALADFVRHVDGVVRVESRLGWHVDDRKPGEPYAPYPQEGAER